MYVACNALVCGDRDACTVKRLQIFIKMDRKIAIRCAGYGRNSPTLVGWPLRSSLRYIDYGQSSLLGIRTFLEQTNVKV